MEEIQIRGRGRGVGGRGGVHRNKQWVAGQENGGHGADAERWDRGGHRGRGRGGRGRGTISGRSTPFLSAPATSALEEPTSGTEDEGQEGTDGMQDGIGELESNDLDEPEDMEKFWKELVKARDAERKRMIAEKKMADPDAPMRLEDAITPVGTCEDMCPRFERYRREREHNLDKWEVIPGTKRVDHQRAVKMYERASGSKSLPSDLRTPEACRKTLDYLFHDLLPRGGFTETHSFIRDRSRAIRNDFTPQLITGPIAIECHDRCARFHIVAMHLQRDVSGFDLRLEEQQLSHALLSLHQFYDDQRKRYTSSTEMEMRVYHRLISIRDLKERHEDVPLAISSHPVFELTTKFRLHVQKESAPISRTSPLRVGQEGMQIFGELASVLQEQNNVVMIYLMACILERLFGKDTIENLEGIRGDLSIPDVIDGISQPQLADATSPGEVAEGDVELDYFGELSDPEVMDQNAEEASDISSTFPQPVLQQNNAISSQSSDLPKSAFANIVAVPNAFGSSQSVFGGSVFGSKPTSAPGGVQPAFGSSTSFLPTFGPATSAPPVSGIGSFGSGSIFSADTRSKPFGGRSSSTFDTPSAGLPLPLPPAVNGSASQQSQAAAPIPPTIPTTVPLLNPQATAFVPTQSPFFAPIPHIPSLPIAAPALQLPLHVPSSVIQPSPPASSTISAEVAPKPATPQPRIIERRQTLWDLPGSDSPQRTPGPKTSVIEIPPRMDLGRVNALPTPIEPPPLGRQQPLELPPTPTARWFDPSSQQSKQTPISSLSSLRKQSLIGFPTLQMPATPTQAEILSPLHIPSPGSLKWPPAAASPSPASMPNQPCSSLFMIESPVSTPTSSKAKGKSKEVDVSLEDLAVEFSRRHSPMVKCFKKWVGKVIDRAAWQEACRRSDAYKEKIQREHPRKVNGTHANGRTSPVNKRRASGGVQFETPTKKRARRRISTDQKVPLTDDELVQQLRENQEEHQRRWAPKSFLETIRRRVQALSPGHTTHPLWRTWLTLNTENDGTAIWLEHKFGLPEVGEWISDNVFSIPGVPHTSGTRLPLGSPGLIVFERTPLEEITDPIERKYRILDDCTRLRDIVEGLVADSKLRFIPSLLVINWPGSEEEETTRDFSEMMRSFAQEGYLKSCYTFTVSSMDTNLDKTFGEILDSMDLEVEDRLVQTISWTDLTDLFINPFRSSASDWLYSCWFGDHFDWTRYSDVLKAIQQAQYRIVYEILGLFSRKSEVQIELPIDAESPAHLGTDYATGPFLDVFVKLAIATAERLLENSYQRTLVLSREGISIASDRFRVELESISERLRGSGMGTLLKWSKRRADDAISPTSTPKRLRPSLSRESSEIEMSVVEDSPPPSTLATSTAGHTEVADKTPITVAMLRALTRDILKSR